MKAKCTFARLGYPHIHGLRLEVRQMGKHFTYLCYCDRKAKWKIVPSNFNDQGKPETLVLYHRNAFGEPGFHQQGLYNPATPAGLYGLVKYIRQHEAIESQQIAQYRADRWKARVGDSTPESSPV